MRFSPAIIRIFFHSFSFRLQSLAVEYKKLEDEFRDALKIEERRYQEVILPLFLLNVTH